MKEVGVCVYARVRSRKGIFAVNIRLFKMEIIYYSHHGNTTKGVVVNNVHTIFRAVLTQECHLSKRLLILILSFFFLCEVDDHLLNSATGSLLFFHY